MLVEIFALLPEWLTIQGFHINHKKKSFLKESGDGWDVLLHGEKILL